jgi:low temperature requirement protein LtrA
MTLHHFIQSPRLWPANPRNERRVSWMELLCDLIFVAPVAQMWNSLRGITAFEQT